MSIKNGFNNTSVGFKVLYLIKAIALLVLCRIHDFTRYKVCRSFSDLFYWSKWACVDMLVVLNFFIIGSLMLYNTFVFYHKCIIKTENKFKNNIISFPVNRR